MSFSLFMCSYRVDFIRFHFQNVLLINSIRPSQPLEQPLCLMKLWCCSAIILCCAAIALGSDPVEDYIRLHISAEVIQHHGWQNDLGGHIRGIRPTNHLFEIFAGTAGITRKYCEKGFRAHPFEIKTNRKQDMMMLSDLMMRSQGELNEINK